MATTERVFTIPLRREWVKQPRIRRANRSVNVIREYFFRHLKADEVKLSRGVNELLWASGAKSPPARIKVAVEVKEGVAFARLPNEQVEVKKEGKKVAAEKLKEKTGGDKTEAQQKGKEQKTDAAKNEGREKIEEKKERPKELTEAEKEAERLWKEAEEKAKKT